MTKTSLPIRASRAALACSLCALAHIAPAMALAPTAPTAGTSEAAEVRRATRGNPERWSCRLTAANVPMRSYAMHLRADGTAVIDTRAAGWSRAADGSLQVTDPGGDALTLREEPSDTRNRLFVGRTDADAAVRCAQMNGSTDGLFADGVDTPLVAALTGSTLGATSRDWSCTISRRGETATIATVTYRNGGRGVLDGADMRWFVDQYHHLHMSDGVRITVFDDARTDARESQLTARVDGRPVLCTPT